MGAMNEKLELNPGVSERGSWETSTWAALKCIDKIANDHKAKIVDIRGIDDEAKLNLLWFSDPERDPERKPTYDLMDLEKRYSESELEVLVPKIVTFELTTDCNGDCPFCGEKSPARKSRAGVAGKFSFKSVREFLYKYGKSMGKDIVWYGLSDPFDYRDGQYSFLDVYREWKAIRPEVHNQVTTSIPKGGQSDFINFVAYLMDNESDEIDQNIEMRVSVAPHNIARIRTTVEMAIEFLQQSGYSDEQIDNLFNKYFSFESRFPDDVYPVGLLIHRRDPYETQVTPTSYSGVRIGPPFLPDEEIRVNSTVWCATTKYTPTSYFSIPVTGTSNIVAYEHTSSYKVTPELLQEERDFNLMPKAMNISGEDLVITEEQKEELNISRDIRSLFIFMENLRRGCVLFVGIDPNKTEETANEIMDDGTVVGRGMTPAEEESDERLKRAYLVKMAEKYRVRFCEEIKVLPNTTGDKGRFYLDLYRFYKMKADYLVDLIERGLGQDMIEVVGKLMLWIKGPNKDRLPVIIDYLETMSKTHENLGTNRELWKVIINDLATIFGRSPDDGVLKGCAGNLVFAFRGKPESEEDYLI